MSLTNTNSRVGPYTLSTLPQVLAVSFPFQAATDLKVYNIGTAVIPVVPAALLTLNSDYTVTGGGYDVGGSMQTGSVTVASGGAGALAVGDIIVILRTPAQNQLTSFLSTGLLTVAMIEQALDKQATLVQDLQAQVNSTLRIPVTDEPLSAMLWDERANMLLSFDGNGNFAYVALDTAVAAATAVADAAAAAAALSEAAAAGSAGAAATAQGLAEVAQAAAEAQVVLAAAQVALAADQVALAEAEAVAAAASAVTAESYAEPAIYALGNISGSVQLDYSNGLLQGGTVNGSLTLTAPLHGVAGKRLEVWLTASGSQTLDFDAAIKKPSDSGATWPKTLTTGRLYIVQLKYSGTAWMLATVVGGY